MQPFLSGEALTEWQECRQTIGRLDTIIADLRKFGFSLVTVLITASGLVGQQVPSSETKASVSIALIILITVLFSVDRYYTLLLNGAVERALDLEGPQLNRQDLSQDRLTQVISVHAINSGAVFVVLLLYLGLLYSIRVLASALDVNSAKLTNFFWGCFLFIAVYFIYTEWRNKTGFFRRSRLVA
jgi:hypothetical protein